MDSIELLFWLFTAVVAIAGICACLKRAPAEAKPADLEQLNPVVLEAAAILSNDLAIDLGDGRADIASSGLEANPERGADKARSG